MRIVNFCVQSMYPENLQTKLIVNFLNFLVITHTLKYAKQRRSYDCWNIVHTCKTLNSDSNLD
jgi:hypothetical protein